MLSIAIKDCYKVNEVKGKVLKTPLWMMSAVADIRWSILQVLACG